MRRSAGKWSHKRARPPPGVAAPRESYGPEHVRRVLRFEARAPYHAPRHREKCAAVHGPGSRGCACRTCHFCRRACACSAATSEQPAGGAQLPAVQARCGVVAAARACTAAARRQAAGRPCSHAQRAAPAAPSTADGAAARRQAQVGGRGGERVRVPRRAVQRARHLVRHVPVDACGPEPGRGAIGPGLALPALPGPVQLLRPWLHALPVRGPAPAGAAGLECAPL